MTTRRLIQPAIAFRDAAFDTARCEKFCLVLEIGPESLKLAVLDNLSNDFLAFEQYTFRKSVTEAAMAEQLEKLVLEHEWLTGGFKRIDAIVSTERFTLVPAAFFDSSRTGEFLRFNQPVSNGDIILNDVLRNAEARNIYAIDPKLERALRKISSAVRVRHHLSPLIERQLSVNKNKLAKRVFAHVQQHRFDLVISENGKLLLANTFRFQTSEDFIYFLLYSCEQLKLNPEELELEIAGEVETESAVTAIARKYIRHVHFGSYPVDARFSRDFSQFPVHFHHNLFALHYYS
jgi:hypothetical protein